MLSNRSPKSTKEVAKKLEDAQLRDEQTVRKLLCTFNVCESETPVYLCHQVMSNAAQVN